MASSAYFTELWMNPCPYAALLYPWHELWYKSKTTFRLKGQQVMALQVLIVGAGISGLAALKQCLADDIAPTVFDALPHIGGQWHYSKPTSTSNLVVSSIYDGVVINSCRDTTAFSDFPIDPARYPQYFSHRKFLQYIHEYTDYFGLRKYIRLNTKVLKAIQVDDGKWEVTYQENDKEPTTKTFDALFACTGTNSKPRIPEFIALETFQGQFFHSHYYRTPAPYEGKKVAVIGIGSSAVDISSEIAPFADEFHLITRRGGWVIPRFVFGKPVEAFNSRIETVIPPAIADWIQQKILNIAIGQHPKVIKPKHKILEASPTVHSNFLEKVRVGQIKPHRAGVDRFTEDGVILTDGTKLAVDVVISCTGYLLDFPYLPQDSFHAAQSKFMQSDKSLNLYQMIVPPNYQNLFFLGILESDSALAPCVELQARWATAILTGKLTLPRPEKMSEEIAARQVSMSKHFVRSDRHAIMIHGMQYNDDLASQLEAAPTFGRLLSNIFKSNPIRAISLMKAIYFDMPSAAQYRLFGHGGLPELGSATVLRVANEGEELSLEEKEALEALSSSRIKA
ncbi:MAG: hypothetical protein M1834_008473 [Cirrosporium novae-zelandiae]|nr:MAG: hypothetical protein M1834_008473 [Cirrosporium novae-zelandiae]